MHNYTIKQTACFTGGRPKSLYSDQPYSKIHRYDYDLIASHVILYAQGIYINEGIRHFISGGAQGFDTIAFYAIQKLKEAYPDIENIVYVPFNNQDSKWAEHGLFSKQTYREMLKSADEVIVCDTTFNPESEPFNKVVRKLMERNEHMVNDSSLVIGQYPDSSWSSPTAKGGTASCLRYAASLGKDVCAHDFRPGEYSHI